MNRNIQLTDHLETGTHIFFLWPATGRSIPYAVLRADALLLLLVCDRRTHQHYRAASFASETHPIPQSRRVLRFRDAPDPLLYCVPAHFPFTEPASLQI